MRNDKQQAISDHMALQPNELERSFLRLLGVFT